MAWTLSTDELLAATSGRLESGSNQVYSGVGTDTRSDLKNKIFFALQGDQFDAHHYLESAVQAQAGALVVHDTSKTSELKKPDSVAIIKVENTLVALQNLANYWRRKNHFRVVGITGSNGKTTCKEFVATLVKTHFKTHWSKGSFNNHWGVPITLLEAPQDTEVVICEMGMNHQGELIQLSNIAEPDIVLCTTVARAHLGHFKDTSEIAAAKNEIYAAAPQSAFGVFNLSHPYTREMFKSWRQLRPDSSFLTYSSTDERADLNFKYLGVETGGLKIEAKFKDESYQVKVPVFGRHNVENLAGSSAVAFALGLTAQEISERLPYCENAWGRNQWLKAKGEVSVLFDAYNANPESMTALLESVKELPGKKVALLGEMREMGEASSDVHFEIGKKAAVVGFREIGFVAGAFEDFKKGLQAGGYEGEIKWFQKAAEASQWLSSRLQEGDLLAVKASRGVELEKAVSPLIEGGLSKPS